MALSTATLDSLGNVSGVQKVVPQPHNVQSQKIVSFPPTSRLWPFCCITLACTAKSYIEHGFMLYRINKWRCSNFVLHDHGKWASQAHAGIHMIWICGFKTTSIVAECDVIVSRTLLNCQASERIFLSLKRVVSVCLYCSTNSLQMLFKSSGNNKSMSRTFQHHWHHGLHP